jgi:hypothetical protein
MGKAYLKAIHEIDKLKGRPFGAHDISGVSPTTCKRVLEMFMILKMVTKFPRGFNYRYYQTTKSWTTAEEAVNLYEMAQTMRKPYGHKDDDHDLDVQFFRRKA